MVFVPAPDTVKVDLRQTLFGQLVSNTVYFRKVDGSVTVSDMTILAGELVTWWGQSVAPELTESITLNEVYVTDLSSQAAPTATVVPTPSVQGELVQPSLPSNVAFCVSFRTSGRGRSARGRNYIAGLSEGDVAGNVLETARVGGLVGAYNILSAAASLDTTWEHVIVSTVENGEFRATALVQPVVAVIATDNNVDSQRRRLTGRGR